MPEEIAKPKGQEPVSKEVEKFVQNAIQIIHSEKVTDNILNTVQKSEDPVDAVGDLSVEVADRLGESAAENNVQLNAGIMAHGINLIVGEIINIVETAGVAEFNKEQRYQAYSWALSRYLKKAVDKGIISKEEVVRMGESAAQTPEGREVAKQMRGEQPRQTGNRQPPGKGLMRRS